MTQPKLEISPAKRALREARLRGQYREQPIVPRAEAGDPPLSFAQERLWFIDRLLPGNTAYNLNALLRLPGELDEGALRRALGEIVRRHEALRTTFREREGTPVQVIAPWGGFPLPVEDLSALSLAGGEAEVRRRAAEEAVRPFDLSAGPLFRAFLFRLSQAGHLLLMCTHHIVNDVWSQKVFQRELRVLYDAYRQGRESPLPDLPIQYADYAAWQRSQRHLLEGRHLAYWKRQLAGAPELLELPADRLRPPIPSFRGGRVPIDVRPEVLEGLRELARGEGATLHMVALAVFQALLARHTGCDDVVVGSPVAGRARRELEGLIGVFVNTVALRTDLSGDPDFRGVVRRVRETALGAYQHQELPFERVVAAVRPERSLSHAMLFQVMFTLDVVAEAPAGGEGLRMQPAGLTPETTLFDLSLSLTAHPQRLRGVLEYAAELFDHDTAVRMAAQLERVLEQVAADPGVRLSALELMSDAERRQVVREWNRTDAEFPADRCIHHLFEAQAARTPGAVALVHEHERLTYRELNERANRVAHHLLALVAGPEARVGVCLERGPALVAALLGVLKAGAAYVPLDPAYPAERLALTLRDSAVAALLTQDALRGIVPVPEGVRVVDLDPVQAREPAREDAANPRGAAGPGNLAYLIYTSGSTGVPKGVAIEHQSAVALLSWAAGVYSADELSGVLASTSVCFDMSIYELFLPLAVGGRIVLVDNALALPHSVAADQVRLINTVPSAIAALLAGGIPAGVRTLNLGGEPLPADLVDAMYAQTGIERVYDLYGPSEDTTYSTYALRRAGAPATIGRPIANTRAYVLDAAMRPVPVGVPGELYLGGRGLARGYLGRPGLTAERFVPDALGDAAGGRLYRTGDRVRWRVDGTLECLGRRDAQVKIRGFRIEPGEIEAVLRRHAGVRDCVVVAREDAPGEKRLVAYLVGEADPEALRESLRRSLPEHMVAGAFVTLEALPLTPNGKVDRRALPAPEEGRVELRYVAPRTPTEKVLAEIWAEMLRLERVGVHDNFFELGGDSILSIMAVSRARRAGLDLKPRQVFEHPSIAGLAAALDAGGSASAPAAEQDRVGDTVPLTPIQAWFFEQDHPTPWHFNQSMLLAVDPALADAALEAALGPVLEHHEALRLRFRWTEAGWEPWCAAGAGVVLERVDLSGLPDAEQEHAQREAAERAQAGLDLERGPPGRAVLFDRGPRGRALLLVLHHLVVDAVSWRILRDDLEHACAQALAGEPVVLGAGSTSYRRWAEVLSAYAASGALKGEVAHWLAQGPDRTAPLPGNAGAGQTFGDAATVTVRLEAEETRALQQAYGARFHEVLLWALAEAVGAWTGSPGVRLALEGHGRAEEAGEGVDLTRTVGWFTSIYPVVLDPTGAAAPQARLKRVQEQLRAVPNRGIGYSVLRYLSPESEVRQALSAQGDPEISFNYLGHFPHGPPAATRLRPVGGYRGHQWAPQNRRPNPLFVDAGLIGGCLQLGWTYGEGVYPREAIERVAYAFCQVLRSAAAFPRD